MVAIQYYIYHIGKYIQDECGKASSNSKYNPSLRKQAKMIFSVFWMSYLFGTIKMSWLTADLWSDTQCCRRRGCTSCSFLCLTQLQNGSTQFSKISSISVEETWCSLPAYIRLTEIKTLPLYSLANSTFGLLVPCSPFQTHWNNLNNLIWVFLDIARSPFTYAL